MQIEQDLILSRFSVEIARDPAIGNQLAMRGGTCLHKLFAKPALRYSEDLDYVQVVSEPSGPTATDGSTTIRIKVEVNTREKLPFREHRFVSFEVQSPWFTGTADVRTFALEELLGTKVRALYQRRKGRDLFDLWMGLTQLKADVEHVAQAFRYYLPAADAPVEDIRQNFADKTTNRLFRTDLESLIQQVPAGYTVESAMQEINVRLVPLL